MLAVNPLSSLNIIAPVALPGNGVFTQILSSHEVPALSGWLHSDPETGPTATVLSWSGARVVFVIVTDALPVVPELSVRSIRY